MDVKGYAVYKDVMFETDFDLISGSLKVSKYVPNVKNRSPKDLIGAFALIIGNKRYIAYEYMDLGN